MEKMKGSDVKAMIEARREYSQRLASQISQLQECVNGNDEEIKTLQERCPHEWEKVIPEAVLKTCKFCGLLRG